MIKKTLLTLFLVLALPFAALAQELTVAVAANVQFAFDELKAAFEKDTGVSVKGIIGSSGRLTTQVQNGAPFHVFLSADTDYPEALHKEGFTHNTPRVYANGALVLWTLNNLDLSRGIHVLTDPAVKKIALATPKTAPYGRQAVNALKTYQLYESTRKKLVYGENIAQANQFITSRASDIGFTAKSVVVAPNMKDKGTWIEIDPQAYETIAQAAVVLKFAEKNSLAQAQQFFDFLFSEKARDIFEQYGYTLP